MHPPSLPPPFITWRVGRMEGGICRGSTVTASASHPYTPTSAHTHTHTQTHTSWPPTPRECIYTNMHRPLTHQRMQTHTRAHTYSHVCQLLILSRTHYYREHILYPRQDGVVARAPGTHTSAWRQKQKLKSLRTSLFPKQTHQPLYINMCVCVCVYTYI